MAAEIRIERNIYNEHYISLWEINGMEIETAWGKTYLSAFWMLFKRLYRRGNLKYLFQVKQFRKGKYGNKEPKATSLRLQIYRAGRKLPSA